MPFYECNEQQFVENIRRLIETSEKFIVNRKILLYDDAKYGPSILPEEEFNKYTTICMRKALKSSVFSKIPFIDEFHHGRMHDKDENLHGSTSLSFPRMSIPYYKVEYSMNIWGSTYFFSFDALFGPVIVIEKRSGKRLGNGSLIHVLKYKPPDEKNLAINLPENVMVFDVKNMARVIDYSLRF